MDHTIQARPQTDETAFEEALVGAIIHREDFDELLAEVVDSDELHVVTGATFESDGVMTHNRGVVVALSDGSEFQITVVRSR